MRATNFVKWLTIHRIRDIPSRIAFEFTQFPNNVPLPSHQTSARILGGLLHFLHLCVRVSQGRAVPDSELGWEDMYAEDTGASWFSWTIPLTLLLLGAAILNAMYLFTRVKIYRLHRRQDPVSSPNAKYVSEELDFEPLEAPSIKEQLWGAFTKSFRWLLGMKPKAAAKTRTATRILQMEVWTPGDVETSLFCVYSPVHALLWMQTGSSNWIMMFAIMALVGFQVRCFPSADSALLTQSSSFTPSVAHSRPSSKTKKSSPRKSCTSTTKGYVHAFSLLSDIPLPSLAKTPLTPCSVCLPSRQPHTQGCRRHDPPVRDGRPLGGLLLIGFAALMIDCSRMLDQRSCARSTDAHTR